MDSAQSSKRRQKDLMNLILSKYDVKIEDEKSNEFYVAFAGPKDTCYEGGAWSVHCFLPEQYPYKSPSIGFTNKIFHPNVDEVSGTICLDVLNQTWTPIYELKHVFDVFLPQLLMYPNPKDPLNGSAAALYLADQEKYKLKVASLIIFSRFKNMLRSMQVIQNSC
eukprot:TRINITY_DN6491_c0_g1_i1.p3 TRINITY_DN6491_c0_g1~~TRINITY_DN6491_c0_g1_i1.p3  ORF type:complete len:165 (-),score=13.31 TRINITY_DN6491_c0_g1_i1:270-764(-)